MGDHRQVKIQVLRETINGIFDFIERDLGLSTAELPSNFYWTVPDEALYAMEHLPTQLDSGSLNDDLEFVESAHANREQAMPVMFMHLAPLLRALAFAVPSYTSPED